MSDGTRTIHAPGNARYTNFFEVNNLPKGNYSWAVQCLDINFTGGEFSSVSEFTIEQELELDLPVIESISLFPNPTHSMVYLRLPNTGVIMPGVRIRGYSLTGQLVLDQRLKPAFMDISPWVLATHLKDLKETEHTKC